VTATKLSSKGQVVLPSATRAKRNWGPGTEFEVIEVPEGVLLKPIVFPRTTIDEVFGSAGYRGPALSLADMDAAVRKEAARRR
jgi:AbrB family looped-hinge helix DNA binding protein